MAALEGIKASLMRCTSKDYHELEEAAVAGEVLVHQQLLQGVAGGGVVDLAVHCQAAGLGDVGGGINIHVADAVGMAHDWDACVVLDMAHQRIAAPWNDLQGKTRSNDLCQTLTLSRL